MILRPQPTLASNHGPALPVAAGGAIRANSSIFGPWAILFIFADRVVSCATVEGADAPFYNSSDESKGRVS